MSYVVLARKWRPQSFEDLVGQSHVSTTIGNAITQSRVAHAFLFTGVRGVGKTTSARILAKALNCVNGPTPTPCQACPQCVEITAGNDVDVQEIDAASYTGVDDVRRLQESLPYRPSRDRFKIFIVDEVHMLSTNAWNAFLKTLEEPPPHVKFIFATTEVHKVPVTILSRCQRYDFKLIPAQTIAARLRYVLGEEGVAADDIALSAVAREAAGSMRDAMSLLDQVLASFGSNADRLTAETVSRVLGVADRVVLHRLADAMLAGDAGTCVRIVGELSREGYDLPHVAKNFLGHLRDLVVAKVAEDAAPLLDLADEELADVTASAAKADVDDLVRLHQGFSKSYDDIVRGGQPRASLEMTLVRLARRPPLLPIDELLRRLGDLERRLAGGAREPGGPRNDGGGAARRNDGGAAPRPPAREGGPGRMAEAAETAANRGSNGTPAPSASPSVPPRVAATSEVRPAVVTRAAAVGADDAVTPPAVRADSPEVPRAESPAPTPAPAVVRTNGAATAPPSTPEPARAQPAARSNGTGAVAPGPEPDLREWRAVIDRVRAKRPALASVLEHAMLLRFSADRVQLGYEVNSFLAGQATDAAAKDLLLAALADHFGRAPELAFETLASKTGMQTVAGVDTAERKQKVETARKAVADHPLVAAAVELLGAELRDVRLLGEADA